MSTLYLVGDSKQLFAAISVPKEQNLEGQESTLILRREVSKVNWARYSGFAGPVKDLTIWGGNLVALIDDRAWRVIYEGGTSTAGASPGPGERLLALAGDKDVLYGLEVTGEAGEVRIVRLDGAKWLDVGVAGPVTKGKTVVDLAIVGGKVVVAMLEAGGDVSVATYEGWGGAGSTGGGGKGGGGASSAPSSLPVALSRTAVQRFTPAEAPPMALRVLDLGGKLAVWADPGKTNGGTVYLAENGFDPKQAYSMGKNPGEVAVSGGRLRFFYMTPGKNEDMEQVYGFDGKKMDEPIPFGLALPKSMQPTLTRYLQGAALAGLMLGVVLAWRKGAEARPEQRAMAFKLPIASKGKRLLAGIIDLAPWLGVWIYIALKYGSTLGQLELLPVFYNQLVAIAAVVTHTMLGEVIFGRSVGKAIVGLKVATLDGLRPAPGAVVVRNLFKLVDLTLVMSWLAVLFSPLGQSLGDGAAGTVVLDESPSAPKPEGEVGGEDE